jgi:nitroimidazol reductase NimA-like FMN-containing flavoprotein (pyridoxamine 5'-phosphate oxidase superfamily)
VVGSPGLAHAWVMISEPRIRVLLENECWGLLRQEEVGRLAVVVDGRPEIFPVNYVVDHGTVVFRTAEGSKLAALVAESRVAFEIDGETDGDAFSVVVKGFAVEIGDRYELFDAVELPLFPWHIAPKQHFVRILPELVTGRRFAVGDRRAQHAADRPLRRAPPD